MSEEELAPYITTTDYLVSGEEFFLFHDTEFDMLRTTPVPEDKDLSGYYESDEYISHTDSGKGLMAFLYQKVKKHALRQKVKLIKRENNGLGKLLDIGAGTGAFLEAAQQKGWEVKGVEPSDKAREIALGRGIALTATMGQLKESHFDVITLWHVLEHMPDLEQIILDLGKLVRPGGTLIVAVPNFKSYDARQYKEYWAAYDVPRHLWHFSKNSIKKLFEGKFKLVNIKPMIFDSFYVSLLSEKYKTGNKFSIKAIWTGLLSNLKGMSSGEYSSHIYILKNKK